MNKKTFNFFSFLFLCFLLFVICSCEQPLDKPVNQPFKAGLGPIIDLQDPVITLTSPVAGAYIRGITEFTGTASDDYRLDSVFFTMTNYDNKVLAEFRRTVVENVEYNKIKETAGDSRNITWKFRIDTKLLDEEGNRVFPDGNFKIRLRVTDVNGKSAVTDEIIFYIKNDIPEIVIDAPPILPGEMDGYLGGLSLNYGYFGGYYDNTQTFVTPEEARKTPFKRVMDTKSWLTGRISDDQGIYDGDPNPSYQILNGDGVPMYDAQGNPITVELFPPQIRFWQVYFGDTPPPGKDGNPVTNVFQAKEGYIPTIGEVPWKRLGANPEESEVIYTGINNLTFYYTLPDESGAYYAFQVRAQSKDIVHSYAEYPQSYINFDFDNTPDTDTKKQENSFVLILVREPLEYPAVELYQLQDIYGPGFGRVDGMMTYKNLQKDGITNIEWDDEKFKQIEKDGNHSYVNKPIVSKSGPFILRIKASHSGGIDSASVYMQKQDKSATYRLIWDPVEQRPGNWNPSVALPSLAAHYTKWGLNEPDGVTTARSFVFTYTDTGTDRLDNRSEFVNNAMGDISGKSRIQRYGSSPPNDLDDLQTAGLALWTDVNRLDAGTYNIYIYAKSNSGTRVATPFVATITIDKTKPDISLNKIDGSAKEEFTAQNEKLNTVNGVIRPRFITTDPEPSARIRTGTPETGAMDYFKRDPYAPLPAYYPDQAYILILETQKSTMDAYLAANPWPKFENYPTTYTDPDNSVIPGVTVKKHGPIIDSTGLFTTSYIYNSDPKFDSPLPDGDYRLYAFVRDNAFNVGSASWPIKVLRSSDNPTFEFTGNPDITKVTRPDSQYDYNTSTTGESFIYLNDSGVISKRNLFTPNTSIRIKFKDDDGIDLDSPGIKVSITKSKVENEVIVADLANVKEVTPGDIKQAFPSQTTAVKEITGTITQEMLAKALSVNSGILPDGIYRIGISVSDDPNYKLKMSDAHAAPDAVITKIETPFVNQNSETTEYFWIAVDSKQPIINLEPMANGNIILPGVPEPLKGTVSDENGPITIVNWRVLNGSTELSKLGDIMNKDGTPIKNPNGTNKDIPAGSPKIDIDTKGTTLNSTKMTQSYTGEKWESNFTYYMNMNGRTSGTLDFELTFQDRFENKTIVTQRVSVDSEPPKVSLNKKIDTFQRDFPDVILTGYNKVADDSTNRKRLAVGVVNFEILATDNNRVKGVRWWLLPASVGADNTNYSTYFTGLTSTDDKGDSKGYNAWPSSNTGYADPGTYYTERGAYGVVDMENRQFTIAIDSTKLKDVGTPTTDGNGEYRLYIIAVDMAGNYSSYKDNLILNGSVPQLFQEVFFLQEQDKPYFVQQGSTGNITPGKMLANGQLTWPTAGIDDIQVLGGAPIIRGTIYENNGFFKNKEEELSWDGSIVIWFSKDPEPKPLPNDWETRVKADIDSIASDIDGYIKKEIKSGIGRQGKNISLTIPLKELFPEQFNTDGKKRYIIRATDSPVNKLKYGPLSTPLITPPTSTESVPGIPMGIGLTASEDEGVRKSSYRQFAFIYDAIPPVVKITEPQDKKTFGSSFASSFILGGNISDANLATMKDYYQNLPTNHPDYIEANYDENGKYTGADNRYYFEYYLNSNTKKVFPLEPGYGVNLNNPTSVTSTSPAPQKPADSDLVSGKHIYAITKDDKGVTTVYFRIAASEVSAANGIIPLSAFNALGEGQHTLTLWATDKSGKEGAAWINFIKDIEPPKITFSNLAEKSYDTTNKSMVDKNWWTKPNEDRQTLLFGNNLPLTTIYYDSGAPELRGTITDLVSNIKLTTGTDTDVGTGDVNISDSAFKYWIDGDENSATTRYEALIDGKDTKSVRWTILLTANGKTTGTPLCDGVHTIMLTAADDSGEYIKPDKYVMIAFRIDSKTPKAMASDDKPQDEPKTVFGNVAYQNSTMFTVNLGAQDANLDKMVMSIVKQGETKAAIERIFKPSGVFMPDPNTPGKETAAPTGPTNTWAYVPYKAESIQTLPSIPDVFIPPLSGNPTSTPLTEDYIVFIGKFPVPNTLFNGVDSGRYDVKVAAWDTFGNKSEEYIFQFTYDKTPPVIQFTNPTDTPETPIQNASAILKPSDFIDIEYNTDGSVKELKAKNKITRFTSQNLRIQGNVKDILINATGAEVPFSPVRQVQSYVERWDWGTAGWVDVEGWMNIRNDLESSPGVTTNTSSNISWTKNLLGQDSGPTVYPGTLLDLGNPDTWGKGFTSGVTVPKPDVISAEGLYRIRIRAKDASTIILNSPGNPPGNDEWYNPATGDPTSQGNPAFSQYVYFYYDRTNPVLEITNINTGTGLDTYYSKPKDGFTFKGKVTDDNRWALVEVKFQSGTKTVTKIVHPANLNQGTVTQFWEAKFLDAADYPDGKYKVTVTAYDMTGRTSTPEVKSFILDSTPPTVKFTLPAKEDKSRYTGFGDDSESSGFASVTVEGGPSAAITGETGDKPSPGGESGSQSGVDQMWFHLGFIDGDTYNNTNQFPTKDRIKAWEDTLIQKHTGLPATDVAALNVKKRNEYMDTIAEYRAANATDDKGNAWFKLGGIHKPTGFIINNPNIYDWRFEIPNKIEASMMPSAIPATPGTDYDNYLDYDASHIYADTEIGGLNLYAGKITIKGREYSIGGQYQMVRAVSGQPGGVYRLPLWIRLTDIAGNVEYYCHDIWFDTNGQIPSTTIESPDNGTKYNAKGGTISVDGVAKSNTSVYDVIFRVFADNVMDTNLDGIQTLVNGMYQPGNTAQYTGHNKTIGTNGIGDIPSGTGKLVRITGYDNAKPASVAILPAAYRDTNWQQASMTKPGGTGETLIPWSIMLNVENQLRDLMGNDDTEIRVWLEVFVISGTTGPNLISIYANDTKGTASYNYSGANGGYLYGTNTQTGTSSPSTAGARPYVRAFYINKNAPQITDRLVTMKEGVAVINRHNSIDWSAYRGAGQETRSKQLGISASLDPNPLGNSTAALGEVSYRIKIDGGGYGEWNKVWDRNLDSPITSLFRNDKFPGVSISVRTDPAIPARTRYWFDYLIDSKPGTNLAGGYGPVPNNLNWANTGGTLTVQIRMKDNSPQANEAEQTIQVGIDNFTPLADTNYRTNPKVAGSNVNFMGRVYDYANPAVPLPAGAVSDTMNSEFTPRKLARVSVWFTKEVNGQTRYVNMNGGTDGKPVPVANLPTTPPTPRTIAATTADSRKATIVGGGVNDDVTSITITDRGMADSISYPGLGGKLEHNADYVRDITPVTGQPVNKMLWSKVNSADYDVRWQITLDSTLLPDGEMKLHYIVVDEAGNASYYTQDKISVRNNYPEISKLTLYTLNQGIGAAYTAPAEVSYDLNDYRSRMTANYTDTLDNQYLKSDGTADSQTSPANTASRKSDTVGYLNSGFISKNKYIGFKVETLKDTGNLPLNFSLQHVTRERVVLTAANLQKLLRNKSNANNINLYTIAWQGNFTPQRWKEIGVPTERNANPALGTHFILQWPEGSTVTPGQDATGTLPADFPDGTAEVWRYVQRAGTSAGKQGTAGSDGGIVVGAPPPTSNITAPDFGFYNTDFDNIQEYDGSHPDLDDTKYPGNPTSIFPVSADPAAPSPNGPIYSNTANNYNGTAFFLIRVWDSIDTSIPVDERLYDALVVGMNIYKTDTINPVARLYDLNPYTEPAVIENNLNQTVKNAADPKGIGGNIVRGGLYNAGTAKAMLRSGFIDPRGGSKALNPVNSNGVKLPAFDLRDDNDGSGKPNFTISGTARDQVSGAVILRGHAWDDQLIYQIKVKINANERTILQLNPNTAKLEAIHPDRTDITPRPTTDYRNSAFVYDELHWKTGHTAEWAYVWDTKDAPISNEPVDNVTIQVIVVDYKGSPSGDPPGWSSPDRTVADEDASTTNPKIYHNQVSVDVVPYITGFERHTPTFTTKRSLQGWYSFYQGEGVAPDTNYIKVKGYNFGAGAVTMNLVTTSPASTTPLTMRTGASPTEREFGIPINATSGAITLTAATASGNKAAYNNASTTAGKSWNKEFNSFTPGSDLWINRPYAHIWRSAHAVGTGDKTMAGAGTIFAANNTSAGLDSPGMSLQYNGSNAGLLHGAWTVYGRESLFYAQNNSTKPTQPANTNEPFGANGEGKFGLSGSRLLLKAGEPYSASDIDYFNAGNDEYFNNTSVVAAYQRDGEPYMVLKPRLTSVVFNNNNNDGDGGGGDAGYYITRQESPRSTYRWKNARIKKAAASTANGNAGRVFITAYDSTNKRLFFKTVTTINAGTGGNDDNGGTALYLDGGGALTTGILTTGTLGTGPATGGAGNWSAVDYTSDNYPVVAYFDEQNQTLRLAYANSNNPTNGNNWTRRYVLPETGAGSELRRGSGSYVSMEIDRDHNNRVHIAFYNSTYNAVVYATAPSPGGTFTASVIDRVVEGGQWTDISVDKDGNPWIVYADSARTGNRDGARLAYRSYSGTGAAPADAFGRVLRDPVSGNLITGWEAVTMPSNFEVNNDRLNIAAWPPAGYTGSDATSPIGKWNAAVGYASDQFRIGYFFKPGVSMGNN